MGAVNNRPPNGEEMALAASVSMKTAEADLVERHRQGDEQAFREIYQNFETMVYNLAFRMSGNSADAEDIAQETFIRAFRYLHKFRGRSSLKTWIYRIALNCSNSRLKRRTRRRNRRVDDGEVELEKAADGSRSPEEKAVGTSVGDLLRSSLDQLPQHYREAVWLRDFEELSYQEIATVLSVRIGTVRSRIARGREQLRSRLEGRV